MKRTLALVLSLLVAGMLVACSDGGSDDDASTQTTADGGADTTVSTEDYVKAVDEACATALAANAEVTLPPAFADQAAPTSEEFAAYATYLDNTMPTSETFVEALDDMPQPSDSADAEKANDLTDAFGRSLQAQRDLLSAAQSEDLPALQTATEAFQEAVDDYSALLKELGITGCNAT